jgi:hypothetical protein
MNDVQQFISSYSDGHQSRIGFAWNGEHADGFQDANYEFRKLVLDAVLTAPTAAPLPLVRDLFRAETEFSREAWCVDNRIVILAEIMLRYGGKALLMDFLRGRCQSFDASMACGGVRIDRLVAAELLGEVERLLAATTDSNERSILEVGREVFAERAARGESSNRFRKSRP